jgi:hypothetical protein
MELVGALHAAALEVLSMTCILKSGVKAQGNYK